VCRCLRQLKAELNLFIIFSSVPVFEAAKSWAKSHEYLLIGGDEAHFIDGMPIPGRVHGEKFGARLHRIGLLFQALNR
jgi:hypothetical protein